MATVHIGFPFRNRQKSIANTPESLWATQKENRGGVNNCKGWQMENECERRKASEIQWGAQVKQDCTGTLPRDGLVAECLELPILPEPRMGNSFKEKKRIIGKYPCSQQPA